MKLISRSGYGARPFDFAITEGDTVVQALRLPEHLSR